MKRFLFLKVICIVSLSISILLGCSRRQEDPNTITVWHWMTDRHAAFEILAAKYEQQTGIKVKLELYTPSTAYSQKIIASTQAKVLPDIFGILDKKENFGKYIRYGFIADLTEEFEKDNAAWEKSIFPKALDVNRFTTGNIYNVKPGIYGVPLDVTNIQMLYNKDLLEKAGINRPPQTFKEFLEAGEALKRVGISGLVSGWGELWMADCFASNYAFNIMGEEKVLATLKGDVPYNDPDWVKVLDIFKQLSEKEIFVQGIVTKPNKEAEQDFALERAAFAFNGSWAVNVYHDMNPELNYGVMLPPAIKSKFPMKIWGGAGSSFMVNNLSSRKAKAIAFLKWLSAKDQQAYLAIETKNLPANREALKSIPDVLSDFAKVMDQTTHPTIWEINEFPAVIETFDKGIQSIIIGEKTPEQVAQEVYEVKVKEMAKAKKRN